MQRAALRAQVDGVVRDVPLGVFTAGQLVQYDAASNTFRGTSQLFPGTWADGDVPRWNGSAWEPKYRGSGYNNADQVCSVTALADLAGHTFVLPRAGEYRFRLRGAYQSDATTTGLRVSTNFTGGLTSVRTGLLVTTATTGSVSWLSQSVLDTAMGSGSGPGGNGVDFEVYGRIVVSTGGTFAFRVASEVAVANGINIRLGAVSEVWQV